MAGITKEKLIELLNKDLALEYTAIVQYTQHQGVLKGAMYQSITKGINNSRAGGTPACNNIGGTD